MKKDQFFYEKVLRQCYIQSREMFDVLLRGKGGVLDETGCRVGGGSKCREIIRRD